MAAWPPQACYFYIHFVLVHDLFTTWFCVLNGSVKPTPARISCAYFSPSSTRDLPTRYSKNYQTRVSCKFKLTHTHHPNWRLGARPVAHFWMLSIIRLRQHVISPHDIVKPIRPECHANLNSHTHTTQTGVWVPDQWLTSGCFL